MTTAEDFALTVGIQLATFCGGCWLAWKSGRHLSANERRGLYIIPGFFLSWTIWTACELQFPHFFGADKYLSTQWLVERRAGDCLLFLMSAGFSYLFAKVAPGIFAAGAEQHPRPQLSPAEIHERRRVRTIAERRAIPFHVLGFGVWLMALVFGYQMEDGELIAESFIGVAVWTVLVTVLADFVTSRQMKNTEQS